MTSDVFGRYVVGEEIASGGMAKVHLGLSRGHGGFARTVAIKKLHAPHANDAEFTAMFADEARLAARVRHPNVASVIDVVARDGEVALVMEYVHGESLARLLARAADASLRLPPPVVVAIVQGVLRGLSAAHEARDERGAPLGLVHRDVSPQNVIVGADGHARLVDFGIAKAEGRIHTTKEGHVRGKLGYMAPEQLRSEADARSDVYGCGVCLWEALVGRRLFRADNESVVLAKILAGVVDPPSLHVAGLPGALDAITRTALALAPEDRFASALAMASALERAVTPAPPAEVGAWVARLASVSLETRARAIASLEQAHREATRDTRADAVSTPRAAPVRDTGRGRSKAAIAAAVAAIALGFVVATAIGATSPRLRAAPSGAPPASAAPAAEIAKAPAAPASPPPTPPNDDAAREASRAGKASTRAQSARIANTPPRPERAAPSANALESVSPAPPAAPSSTACAQPWWVDADGVRHYKKECFGRR